MTASHFRLLWFGLLLLPNVLLAQVSVKIDALGDGGRVYLGQPAYVDLSFVNTGRAEVIAPDERPIDSCDFRTPQGSPLKCEQEESASYVKIGTSPAPRVWLRAGEEKVVRAIVLQGACSSALKNPGKWQVRAGLTIGSDQRVFSDWKTIEVVLPVGREAQAIANLPNSATDVTQYLREFGDTAVAAPLLARQNEIEAGSNWAPNRSFSERASLVSQNSRWLDSAKGWRLRVTEQFLRKHPRSYFAPGLQIALAAMYVATGDASGAERAAAALRPTHPADAAAILGVAQQVREQKAVRR